MATDEDTKRSEECEASFPVQLRQNGIKTKHERKKGVEKETRYET